MKHSGTHVALTRIQKEVIPVELSNNNFIFMMCADLLFIFRGCLLQCSVCNELYSVQSKYFPPYNIQYRIMQANITQSN